MAKQESTTVKIKFRGEEVEIPKSDEAWFKSKIKADEESAKKETKSK